jgi:serine/threonine protein kinase
MSITRHSGFSALSHMFMSNNLWFFIFDKASDITLAEYIMRREKLPDLEFIQNIALDLFKSLQMLHSQDIVHLDLNLNNIVVDEQQI